MSNFLNYHNEQFYKLFNINSYINRIGDSSTLKQFLFHLDTTSRS